MFRISGAVPAGNFIQLPKASSQSLGLVGHYMYLQFRVIPQRYFVVHLDVATVGNAPLSPRSLTQRFCSPRSRSGESVLCDLTLQTVARRSYRCCVQVGGLVVRISFSNLFKEFKATSTWLQFPFVDITPRWTLLVLDLKSLLRM